MTGSGRWLFFSHSAGAGGAERSLATLIASSVARGNATYLVTPGPGWLEDEARRYGAIVLHARSVLWVGGRAPRLTALLRLLLITRSTLQLRVLIRDLKVDGVLVNSSVLPSPALAARMAGVPVLWMVRESLGANKELVSGFPLRARLSFLRRVSSKTVVVSRYVHNLIGFGEVIYPDVGGKSNLALGLRFAELRTRTMETVGSIRLAMIGQVSPDKGQLEAVGAVMMARADGLDVSLDIFGSGLEVNLRPLLALIESCDGHVKYRGQIEDASAVLIDYDATLVLSRNEAYGRVTAESIIAGCPVLAYPLGGTSEILEAGGGVVSSSADASAMAVLICRFARDLTFRKAVMAGVVSRLNGFAGFGRADDVCDAFELMIKAS